MKLSNFPVGTVVNIAGEGSFQVQSDDLREDNAHCVDCRRTLTFKDAEGKHAIIESVPFGVAWQLAVLLGEEYGSTDAEGEPITYEGLIEQAFEIHNEVEQRVADEAN